MEDLLILDYTLVPTGLLIMLAYHFWLLHRIINRPTTTVVGVNAINRRFWVRSMMDDVPKNGVLAVQTLRNNIMASTLLASTAIMLSSLIAVLMTGGNSATSGGGGSAVQSFIFGDRSRLGSAVKFFCILICFLTAFLFTVQSIRYYSHASILINVPYKKVVAAEYVVATVNRGSYFWSLGLRAFYFSLPMFLWIFGPVPMVVSCLVLVFMLYFLDVTAAVGGGVAAAEEDEDDEEKDEEVGCPII